MRTLLTDATLIAPRGDVSENGALRFFRRTGEGVYDMDDLARATAKMAGFVAAHIEAAAPSRVIGLGYSNGANILASVMFGNPTLLDDAVLMHPLIPWDPAPAPVTSTGPEKVAADLEERRRAGKRYSFSDTILSPMGGKSTLG